FLACRKLTATGRDDRDLRGADSSGAAASDPGQQQSSPCAALNTASRAPAGVAWFVVGDVALSVDDQAGNQVSGSCRGHGRRRYRQLPTNRRSPVELTRTGCWCHSSVKTSRGCPAWTKTTIHPQMNSHRH